MNHDPCITPRNLGSLCLEDACLEDFWTLWKMRFRAPYANFGAALFNDCQKMQEAMIGYYLEKDGSLPKQFAPFCDIKGRVDVNKHWSKFGYLHKSGIWLYGSPDEVLRRKDDTVVIWDHKTAHPKHESTPDRFRPQYEVQITGYGDIAEVGFDLGRVSGGALGYWDLQYKAVMDEPGKFIREGKLWGCFVPSVVEVEIDYSRLDALLKEAKKIWNSKTPPQGREGCQNCKRARALHEIQRGVEEELSSRDRMIFANSGQDPWVFQLMVDRLSARKSSRLAALHELQEDGDTLQFTADSMADRWEFLS